MFVSHYRLTSQELADKTMYFAFLEMADGDKVQLTRQEWYDKYLAAGNVLP